MELTSAYSADGAADGLAEVDIVAGGDLAGGEVAWGSPCVSEESPEREKAEFRLSGENGSHGVRFIENND